MLDRFSRLVTHIAAGSARWLHLCRRRAVDPLSAGGPARPAPSCVPSPRFSADPRAGHAGWFAPVPAYRLAAFRVVLAVTTVALPRPQVQRVHRRYVGVRPFTFPRVRLAAATPVRRARCSLRSSTRPPPGSSSASGRVSARGVSSAVGAWVTAPRPAALFPQRPLPSHAPRLAGCSTRWPLAAACCSEDDDADARCPAWPEQLVRLQVAIVFFYAALDKVFSPFWGAPATGLLRLADGRPRIRPGHATAASTGAFLRAIPGVLSVATILTEFFLAAVALVPRLWPVGLVVGLGFVVSIEFLLAPGLFAWDLLVAGLVFLPAGDRGWTVVYSPRCAACRRNRAILSRLDWLRRLRWVAIADARPRGGRLPFAEREAGCRCIHLRSPRGRAFCGLAPSARCRSCWRRRS